MADQTTIISERQKFKKTPAGEIPVDWEAEQLKNLAAIYSGGTPSRIEPSYFGGSIPWIKSGELNSEIITGTEETITEEGLANSSAKWVPANSVLIAMYGATAGQVALLKIRATINQAILAIIPKEQKITSEYLYYALQALAVHLIAITQGSGQPNLSQELIAPAYLALPVFEEQKKIAEILTAVDESIEKTRAVIEKTKELKKGLMQTLLTRGIGHKKFKKTAVGEIPVEWDARDVGSLTQTMINGGTPDTKVEKYWRGDIPWITGADFTNQKVGTVRRRITKEAVQNSSTNIVPEGAILVVTRTGVGKLAVADYDIAISQDITGIVPDANHILPVFLFWELNLFVPQLKATHQGTSINGVLRSDLERFVIPVPPLQEQKKIAEILTAVDEEVEKEENACKIMKGLKKGLMQNLLSGRVRTSR